jgi:hypothetical protein
LLHWLIVFLVVSEQLLVQEGLVVGFPVIFLSIIWKRVIVAVPIKPGIKPSQGLRQTPLQGFIYLKRFL